MDIREQVLRVREQLAQAAVRAGRDPQEITLVAATKTRSAAEIRTAIAAGVDACGENRAGELTEKSALGAYAGAPLHYIGHLQHNKLRYLVGKADLIQSVDSETLLRLIDRRAAQMGLTQDLLLQVNIGREAQKGGAAPEAADELCALAAELPHVRLLGLMAIPPAPTLHTGAAPVRYFEEMQQLYVDIAGKKYDNNESMRILSMGMSGDFAEAVRAGANMVRVGSAIFGERKIGASSDEYSR